MAKQHHDDIADELARLTKRRDDAYLTYLNSSWAMGPQRRKELDDAEARLDAFKAKFNCK